MKPVLQQRQNSGTAAETGFYRRGRERRGSTGKSFDDKAFEQAGAEIVEGNSVWQSEIIPEGQCAVR